MTFTKAEQRILSPKHERWEKAILWIGIICICVSIALALYMIIKINKIKDSWEEVRLKIDQNIMPTTKQEVKLKSMLLEAIGDRRELWLKYLAEKSFRNAFVIFFIGWFLVVSYYRSRIYTKLIHKLKNSQQANQPDAE